MVKIKIKNDLGIFTDLEDYGIKNFFTYSNKRWGNMSLLSNPKATLKYRKIFQLLNIKGEKFIRINTDGVDSIQLVHEKNLEVYSLASYDFINIFADSVITKESIPITISPGDCAVILITGIDKNDARRFVILIHAGLSGTVLEIYSKAIKEAHTVYKFENKDLAAFIFPTISGKNYVKPINHKAVKRFLEISDLGEYVLQNGDFYEINFCEKVINDLKKLGINNIQNSNIDTFKAHEEGLLYSYTYAKKLNKDLWSRFGIGVYVNKNN